METPNVNDPRFKERFRQKAYPVKEAGGLIWVYLGDPKEEPAFPKWPWLDLPDRHRINAYVMASCNYVQVMEGTLDSSHLSVLHRTQIASGSGSDLKFAKVTNHMQFDAAPRLEVDETDFGFHYAALRNIAENGTVRTEAMVAAFIAPCFVTNPHGDLWFAFVPVNDYRTVFYHVWWNAEKLIGEEPHRSKQLEFIGLDRASLESHGLTWETCDGPEQMTRTNYFKKNKEAARTGHFTGMHSFTQEDAAVSISSGPIRDRSQERLSTADGAISRLYRSLLTCAKQAAEGREPLGLSGDTTQIIGAHGTLAPGVDWRTLVPNHRIISAVSHAEDRATLDRASATERA